MSKLTENKRGNVRNAFLNFNDHLDKVGNTIAAQSHRIRGLSKQGSTEFRDAALTVANYLDDILRSYANQETRDQYSWVMFEKDTVVGQNCVRVMDAVCVFAECQCMEGIPDIKSIERAVELCMVWTHG